MRNPVNMGASVRARLQDIARERNQPLQLLLTRWRQSADKFTRSSPVYDI